MGEKGIKRHQNNLKLHLITQNQQAGYPKTCLGAIFTHQISLQTNGYVREQL